MRFDFIDDALKEQWPKELIDTEHEIDAGEIKVDPETGKHWREEKKYKVDYGLRLNEKYVIAVVEAKSKDESYDEGISQAMKYAEKRVVTIPTPKVTANPFTGPEPKINNIAAAIKVVTFASMTVILALL